MFELLSISLFMKSVNTLPVDIPTKLTLVVAEAFVAGMDSAPTTKRTNFENGIMFFAPRIDG
jgi:hypothetical protein